jgi:hypothetical protein
MGPGKFSVNRETKAKVIRSCSQPLAPPSHRYVTVTGLADGASLRTAMFDGTSHLVVPVVAMVGDSVVWPMNAEGPELVPAAEIAVAPGMWNGRPVVPDHPDGGNGSANEPATMEAMRFGTVFDATCTTDADGITRLRMNAYLDPARAANVGLQAMRVIERCQAGEMVEVSVGAWISLEARSGTHNGQRYVGVWRGVISDHLAMLPEGTRGACNAEMGCGAPRYMRAARAGFERTPTATIASQKGANMKKKSGWRAFAEILARSLTSRSALPAEMTTAEEGASAQEVRDALAAALRATEPGFEWIVDFWPEDGKVVYATAPEDMWLYWRRSYTIGEDGKAALGDDREQVEPEQEWRPVAASATSESTTTAQTPVSGQSSTPTHATRAAINVTAASITGGCSCGGTITAMNEKKKQLIARLMGAAPNVSQSELEGLSEATLEGLVAQLPNVATPATTTAAAEGGTGTEPKATSAPAAITKDIALAALGLTPDQLAGMERAARVLAEQEAKRKTALVTLLKSAASHAYTEAELTAMDLATLERTAKLLKVEDPVARVTGAADFSGRPLPNLSEGDPATTYTTPDPWNLAGLQAKRDKRTTGAAAGTGGTTNDTINTNGTAN